MARTPRAVFGILADNHEIRFKRTGKRDDIFLCSKFGFILPSFALDGSPAHVKEATESSLAKLGVECIDLYYLHVRFHLRLFFLTLTRSTGSRPHRSD
jgi:diketogulonate reductase-like aldo/keto reductase